MADVRPLMVEDLGSGQGRIRQMESGEGEWFIVSPYCSVGGTANALTLTLQHDLGAPSAYRAGQQFRFRASAANTGATTINVEGLGAKTAVTVTGVALPAGYIRTDVDTTITYDAAGDRFVVGREVERGGTARNRFTRYADGTITLTGTLTLSGGGAVTISGVWVYPAECAEAPSVAARAVNAPAVSNRERAEWANTPGNVSVTIAVSMNVNFTNPTSIDYMLSANGVWYL